jgi:hypothetical protein
MDAYLPKVRQSVTSLKSSLSSLDKDGDSEFSVLADENLMALSQEELDGVWANVTRVHEDKMAAIHSCDDSLRQMEADRAEVVRAMLDKTSLVLLDIAHVPPGDIERAIEERANRVNFLILENKKTYADLIARVSSDCIEIMRRLRVSPPPRHSPPPPRSSLSSPYLLTHPGAMARAPNGLAEDAF